MIGREGVGGLELKFGAKFLRGGFEFTLVKVNETRVIVSLRKAGVEMEGGFQFGEGVRVVFLLCVGLSQQKVARSVVGILLQQPTKNTSSSPGLMRADQSGTPRKEQARIVRRVFDKGVQNFNDLRIVLQHGIAEAQKLTDERAVGMRSELAFEPRNSF